MNQGTTFLPSQLASPVKLKDVCIVRSIMKINVNTVTKHWDIMLLETSVSPSVGTESLWQAMKCVMITTPITMTDAHLLVVWRITGSAKGPPVTAILLQILPLHW